MRIAGSAPDTASIRETAAEAAEQASWTPQPSGILSGIGKLVQPVGGWLGSALTGTEAASAPPASDPAPTSADKVPATASDASRPLVVEMAHASGAAYGDRSDPFLEGTDADWQPVTAETLGLAEQGGSDTQTPWVFEGGIFTADPQVDGKDAGEVAVHVGEAVIDGEKTLMVAFRGTDNDGNVLADLADARVPTIKPLYNEALSPATDAILDYVADDANGVDQVLVTGHSLGGIMAQVFMEDADPALGEFHAATFGSSGVNGADVTEDDRIVHVEIAQDPILQYIDRAEAIAEIAPEAAEPFFYDERVLSGQKLVVELASTPAPGDDDPLFEHRMPSYIESIEAFAEANPEAVSDDVLFGDAQADDIDDTPPAPQEAAPAKLAVEDLGLSQGDDGKGVAAFKVAVSEPNEAGTRIDYEVAGTSAQSDWVYEGAKGSLDLPAGQTDATLEVEIEGTDAAAEGEALILKLSGAGDAVEHRFELGSAPAEIAVEAPENDADEPALDEPPQEKAPEWSLHKEIESWLDDARDKVVEKLAEKAASPCEARQLDLGHGRLLKLIDLAEDAAEEYEEDLEDLPDLF